jgi:hypothetical protein
MTLVCALFRAAGQGFGNELVLVGEVSVEAAMRHASLLHDIGHGHALYPALAEKRRGGQQDAAAVFFLHGLAVSHGFVLLA